MLTKEQHAERAHVFGASEVASLFGYGFAGQTAWHVWARLTDRLPERTEGDDKQASLAIKIGNALEPVAIEEAEAYYEQPIGRRQEWFRHKTLPLGAHIDGWLMKDNVPMDAKASGMSWLWGEAESDQAPPGILLQCHAIMMATQSTECRIFAILGGREPRAYNVLRDESIVKEIEAKIRWLWDEHVLTRIPPPDQPDMPTVKILKREPNRVVELPQEVLDEYEQRKEAASEVTKGFEAFKARIAGTLLYDSATDTFADAATFPDGRAVTYYPQKGRVTIDARRLLQERPDIYAEYAKEGEAFRVFRPLKKGLPK